MSSPAARSVRHDLHALRGLAILGVVLAHAPIAYFTSSSPVLAYEAASAGLRAAWQILWHDSTVWFAAISGLLFARYLKDRPWTDVLRTRVVRVLVPYAVLTLVFTLVPYDDLLHPSVVNLGSRYADHLLYGTAMSPYWYIPVIMVVFLFSPVLAALGRIGARVSWPLMLVACVSLVVPRTNVQVSLQSMAYFAGAYAAGMVAGRDLDATLRWLTAHRRLVALVAVTATAALAGLFASGVDEVAAISLRETAFYAQKVATGGLMLVALQGLASRGLPRWLDQVAELAYPIFFVHFVIMDLAVRAARQVTPAAPGPFPGAPVVLGAVDVLLTLAIAAGVTVLALALTAGLRRLFGRASPYLIGA